MGVMHISVTKETMKQGILDSVTMQAVPESTAQWLQGNGFEAAKIHGTDIGIAFFEERAPFRREFLNSECVRDYEITPQELIESARKNMEDDPVEIQDMAQYVQDIMGIPADNKTGQVFTVLRTESGKYGARAIFDPELLDRVAEMYGGDIYVVPSSIHEIIAFKKDSDMEATALAKIILQVNETEVDTGDFLSNTPYVFERGKGLRRADGLH